MLDLKRLRQMYQDKSTYVMDRFNQIIENPLSILVPFFYAGFVHLSVNLHWYGLLLFSIFIHCITGGMRIYKWENKRYKLKTNLLKLITNSCNIIYAFLVGISARVLELDYDFYMISTVKILILSYVLTSVKNYYAYKTGEVLPEFDVIGLLARTIIGVITSKIKSMLMLFSGLGNYDELTKKNDDEENRSSGGA